MLKFTFFEQKDIVAKWTHDITLTGERPDDKMGQISDKMLPSKLINMNSQMETKDIWLYISRSVKPKSSTGKPEFSSSA